MLDRVPTIWHAEAELEVEGLEQTVAEVVALNHAKVLHGLGPHSELNTGRERYIYRERVLYHLIVRIGQYGSKLLS